MPADLEGVGLDYDDDHVLHAPDLRFAVAGSPYRDGAVDAARQLIAAVDTSLTRRAAGGSPNVEALEINFVYSYGKNRYIHLSSWGGYLLLHRHAADITSSHLVSWLRFGARHVTRSFTLAVPTLCGPEMRSVAAHLKEPRLAEFPTSVRADTMSLSLGNAGLAVPVATAAGGGFTLLTDLLLSHVHIEPGSADERNLGRLLSIASCPQLRRLRLEYIMGLAAFRLDAGAALEELRLSDISDLASLELDAPGLRTLRVTRCYRMLDNEAAARISAPKLEVLACDTMCLPDRLVLFHGVESVRKLEKIFLSWSHTGHNSDCNCNAAALWLLRHCNAAHTLDISLLRPKVSDRLEEDLQEVMNHVPQLNNITNLAIDLRGGYNPAAIIAHLVAKCSRVQRLAIDISYANGSCSDGQDIEKISMEHLLEATVTGFHPSTFHERLVKLIMAGAPALEKMTVELFIAKELHIDIPCDRGHWTPCVNEHTPKGARIKTYQWTADKKMEEEEESEQKSLDGLILSRY